MTSRAPGPTGLPFYEDDVMLVLDPAEDGDPSICVKEESDLQLAFARQDEPLEIVRILHGPWEFHMREHADRVA